MSGRRAPMKLLYDLEEAVNRELRQLTPGEEQALRRHFGLPDNERDDGAQGAHTLAPHLTALALRKLRLTAALSLDGAPLRG